MQTYLLCTIHGERFAFEVEKVDEVVRMPWVTAVTETPLDVCGVVDYRGRSIAVVDPGYRLAGESTGPGLESYLVIVEIDEAQVGLVVDAVENLAQATRRSPPDKAGSPDFVLGHFDDGHGLATVVDVATLLRPDVQEFVAHAHESRIPPP